MVHYAESTMCSASVKVQPLHKCKQLKRRTKTLIAFPDTLILETMDRYINRLLKSTSRSQKTELQARLIQYILEVTQRLHILYLRQRVIRGSVIGRPPND